MILVACQLRISELKRNSMNSSRVLVLCEDLHHPAATVRDGLGLLGSEFEFDWIENAQTWTPDTLHDYQMILLAKSNTRAFGDRTPWLEGEHCGAFDRCVSAGGRLLAIHSGTASYRDVAPVRRVLGGVFVGHPPACPVTLEVSQADGIAAGVPSEFSIFDEHYQMEMDDPDAQIFLRSRSAHGVQPAGWTRAHGRGHVCVLTPGHFPAVWRNPYFQQLLRNALIWLRSPVPLS